MKKKEKKQKSDTCREVGRTWRRKGKEGVNKKSMKTNKEWVTSKVLAHNSHFDERWKDREEKREEAQI